MISLVIASILCAATPVSVEEKSLKKSSMVQGESPAYKLGTEVVQTIHEGYSSGSYTEFLKKMDNDYASAKKESALEGLIEIRKEGARAQIHPEFARSYRVIQDSKNQQLMDAVKGVQESLFVQKVKSAATTTPAVDDGLFSIYGKAPGAGKNSDENTLIDIDLEYYYKGIHLDSSNANDRREKHMVLEMEKADRMVKAAHNFEDKSLRSAVEKHKTTLDERLAKNYDMTDLNALALGKIKPVSPAEKEAAAVISRAQGALADLHRHLLDSLDENGQTAQK